MGVYEMRQAWDATRGLYLIGVCYTLQKSKVLRGKIRSAGSSIVDRFNRGKPCALDDFELLDMEIEARKNPPCEN